MRANGVFVMGLLVGLGMGGGAFLYQWQRPKSRAKAEAALAALDALEPEEKVKAWLKQYRFHVRDKIAMYRVSAEQPWLVTHTVGRTTSEGPAEVWGIPMTLDEGEPVRCEQDGMTIRVVVPVPTRLGEAELDQYDVRWIPDYETPAEADGAELIHARVSDILEREKVAWSLGHEIPGAGMVTVVEGDE